MKKSSTLKKPSKSSSSPEITSYLSFTILVEHNYNLESTLIRKIADNNCQILTSNILMLGQDLTISGLISGKWNEIAKIEKYLHSLIKKNAALIQLKRPKVPGWQLNDKQYFNYIVQATTNNQTTVLKELLDFFKCENINVNYAKFNTNRNNPCLANLELQVQIPINLPIMHLRENFLLLCERLNLDTSLEPLLNS